MSTEPATMNWRDHVGRFFVEFEVANHEDVVQAKKGFLPPEQVRTGSGFGRRRHGCRPASPSGLGGGRAGFARSRTGHG